jgi:hypothetical protein
MLIVNMRSVPDVNLQEHPCNARRDTADKTNSLHAKSSLFRPICVAKELTDPDVNMY